VQNVHPCCVFMPMDVCFVLFLFCVSTCVCAGVCSSSMFVVSWFLFCSTSLLFWLHVYAFAFKSEVHCGSAFEPGACGLPSYCTPPVTALAVIGARAVWRQNKKEIFLAFPAESCTLTKDLKHTSLDPGIIYKEPGHCNIVTLSSLNWLVSCACIATNLATSSSNPTTAHHLYAFLWLAVWWHNKPKPKNQDHVNLLSHALGIVDP